MQGRLSHRSIQEKANFRPVFIKARLDITDPFVILFARYSRKDQVFIEARLDLYNVGLILDRFSAMEILVEFLESSTIHGLTYISTAKVSLIS